MAGLLAAPRTLLALLAPLACQPVSPANQYRLPTSIVAMRIGWAMLTIPSMRPRTAQETKRARRLSVNAPALLLDGLSEPVQAQQQSTSPPRLRQDQQQSGALMDEAQGEQLLDGLREMNETLHKLNSRMEALEKKVEKQPSQAA